jgi:hypothetical protein
MDLTPELIDAFGKTAVSIIAAIGAVAATIASAITAVYTFRNRRDLHIAHDRIRNLKGEPLQYRYDPNKRLQAKYAAQYGGQVDAENQHPNTNAGDKDAD